MWLAAQARAVLNLRHRRLGQCQRAAEHCRRHGRCQPPHGLAVEPRCLVRRGRLKDDRAMRAQMLQRYVWLGRDQWSWAVARVLGGEVGVIRGDPCSSRGGRAGGAARELAAQALQAAAGAATVRWHGRRTLHLSNAEARRAPRFGASLVL